MRNEVQVTLMQYSKLNLKTQTVCFHSDQFCELYPMIYKKIELKEIVCSWNNSHEHAKESYWLSFS